MKSFLISFVIGLFYLWIGDAEARFIERKFFDGHFDLTRYFLIVFLWPLVLPLLAIACIVAFVRIIVGKISK